MKRLILATLILIAGTVGIANAQLTPSLSGHYYSPFSSGQGVELHVLPSGKVFALLFLGRVGGWYPSAPVWLSAQGTVTDDGIFPLYESRAVFGIEQPLDLVAVGQVQIYVRKPDCQIGEECLVARISIDGRGYVSFSPAPEPVTEILYLTKLL